MSSFKEILNKYRDKKYFFFNHPGQIENIDYEKSLREMVEKFSKIKDVCSIYNYTGQGVLGISDLDLFVLLRNNFQSGKRADFDLGELSSSTGYLADITIQRKDLFEKMYYRYHYRWAAEKDMIYCLWGEKAEPEKIGEKESHLDKVYYLAGVYLTKMPRDLLRSLTAGRISVRGLLKIIHTLRFSIVLENQVSGLPSKPEWLDFIQRFEGFRKSWFDLGKEKYQALVDYLIEAADISFQLVEEFSDYVQSQKIFLSYPNPEKKKLCGAFSGFKFFTLFYDKDFLPEDEALKLNLQLNEKGLRAILLPSVFQTYMWEISRAGQDKRSDYVKKNLILLDKEPDIEIPLEMKKREELLNQYIEFLSAGNMIAVDPGDAQGVFGFYEGSTLKERLFEKARNIFSQWNKKRMINLLYNQKSLKL